MDCMVRGMVSGYFLWNTVYLFSLAHNSRPQNSTSFISKRNVACNDDECFCPDNACRHKVYRRIFTVSRCFFVSCLYVWNDCVAWCQERSAEGLFCVIGIFPVDESGNVL